MTERIMIIEDDAFNREFLRILLSTAGFSVVEASDGFEALAMLQHSVPDLILLDVVMPELDGISVCRKIKEKEILIDIPVIFLSSRTETQDKIIGLNAGASDYIAKPFETAEILARVRVHLDLQRVTRELRLANQELILKQQRIDQDLIAAERIQRKLLPQNNPIPQIVDVAWKFRPSHRVGGDIFNMIRLDADHMAFYILDVSGHGVHSALVAVSAFQSLLPQGGNVLTENGKIPTSPAEVLSRLDAQFPQDQYEQYFTMFYLLLNITTGEIRYSAAGHPPGVVLSRDGELSFLDKGGSLIGLGGLVPFEEGQYCLSPGDRVILYTDGLTDYENATGEFYGLKRFQDRLQELSKAPLSEILEGVWEHALVFGAGAEPADDISLLGITFLGLTTR